MSLDLSLFMGGRSATPIRRDVFDSFADLTEALIDLVDLEPDLSRLPSDENPESPGAQKLCMYAFGPYRLRANRGRANDNVKHLSLVVLDVDQCEDLDGLLDRLDDSGLEAFVYTSPSDGLKGEARRVRVLVPADRPIAPEDCRATRYALAHYLGLSLECGVREAHDPARIFFIGRLIGTPPREWWVFGGGR